MGEGASSNAREDWAHEGRGWAVLASGDSGQQSEVGAGQRDCEVASLRNEGMW